MNRVLFSHLILFLFSPTLFAVAPTREGLDFFEAKIRPIFAEHCLECHGVKKQSAALRLDRKADLLKGGDTGPILSPQAPEKSLLLQVVSYKGEVKMPPKQKLSEQQIADLRTWIKIGAPIPEDSAGTSAGEDPKKHWAFQPLKKPNVPKTQGPAETDLDRFVLAKLEANKQSFAPEADRKTLLRRLYLDLTGLPPTESEINAFVNDPSPNAYEIWVDRILAMPQYGEHQARHWMDLARYSDTKGYVFNEDRNYPYAYTYRDWLIRSFNEDMPYDQFILYQLAADRIVKQPEQQRHLAAMGFLTVGRRFLNVQPDIIDDRIDVTFRTFQALTVSCARCHDHKFDPIPIKDYYSIYGVFASSIEPKELPLLQKVEETPEVIAFNTELKKREQAAAEMWAKIKRDTLAKFHSPEQLTHYLLAVRDAWKLPSPEVAKLAGDRKLVALVLERWLETIRKRTEKHDPVFSLLVALFDLEGKTFAEKSPEVLKTYLNNPTKGVHPTLKKNLENISFQDFQAVVEVYAKTFHDVSKLPSEKRTGDELLLFEILTTKGPFALNDKMFERIITIAEKNKYRALARAVEEWKAKSPAAPPRGMVLIDAPKPFDPYVFNRGNQFNRGPQVPRQFLEILSLDRKPFTDGSGRIEMARAIANKNNPLTARVFVNRVWGHLFGQAIVRTPSDFGLRSDPPTHPELLDYLASQFQEQGWSIKKLHKILVMSRTYRQQSQVTAAQLKEDPENRLFGRMNRKRMTFEQMRDSMLAVSGQLDRTLYGKPVEIFKEATVSGRPVEGNKEVTSNRRTLYGLVDRQNLSGTLRAFDFAIPDSHSPQRFNTTVPQQALFLLNSPFVRQQAEALSQRFKEEAPPQRVEQLYSMILGRKPTSEELQFALEFAKAQPNGSGSGAWRYGYGDYNPSQAKTVSFTPLPFATQQSWQGGPQLPDPKLGWCMLMGNGGHPGEKGKAVIRRWISPIDGEIEISGQLQHPAKQGDGVRGRIVSNQSGMLGEWKVHNKQVETRAKLKVKKEETIDFITDCLNSVDYDSFLWTPRIKEVKADSSAQQWNAESDFRVVPVSRPNVWTDLAQVLLLSNEFVFID